MKIKRCFILAILAAVFIFSPYLYLDNAAQAGDLKAPKVVMIVCLPSFLGAESIAVEPLFSISNPNDSLIGVSLDYLLQVGGQNLGKSQVPKVFIPPKETIEIKGAFVVPFKAWFAAEALGGKGPKGAVMSVTPLWKGLGGLRPAILKEEIWKKIPARKAPLLATGSMVVEMGGASQVFNFTSQWED